MKFVLDTNVFISGVFFTGPPHKILQAWQLGDFELVLSEEILDEYQRVGAILANQYPQIHLEPILNFVIQHASVYRTGHFQEPVCEDPDDDKFLACALASGCTLIISGDKHLLKVSGFAGIEIVKPRDFVNNYLK
jgi:putative PIN family toxin of toxin-antitoxin system